MQREWLSYDFWQCCGLTSPGFCALKFDNSNSRISGAVLIAPVNTTVTVLVVAVIFLLPGLLTH